MGTWEGAWGNGKISRKVETLNASLTISRHSDSDALLEAAVLAPVPVDAHDVALLILEAGPVLDLLLDGTAEEALATLARVHAIVEARRLVSAHPAQHRVPVKLCNNKTGQIRVN